MLTFGQVCNRISSLVQIPSSDGWSANVLPKLVQQVYKEIWDGQLWPGTLQQFTATIKAQATSLTLPKNIATILRVYTGGQFEQIGVLDLLSYADSQVVDSTGVVDLMQIAPTGSVGVLNQLTSAQRIKLSSSAAADTAVNIYIRGTDSNGETLTETLKTNSTNGTTAVTSSNTYATITRLAKADNTSGIISVTDNSGATTLATMGAQESAPEYQYYMISDPQTNDTTITCYGKKVFTPLLNSLDVPFMEMDNALVLGGCASAWRQQRQLALAADYESKYQKALMDLMERELEDTEAVVVAPFQRC